MLAPDWSQGALYLIDKEPRLAPLVKRYGQCTLKPEAEENYFAILVRGIISQQLPPEVANNIYLKIQQKIGSITPKNLLEAKVEVLLGLGLMTQKIAYLHNFSRMVLKGSITPENFFQLSDTAISKQLLQVKGLGQWTIDMFLLLALCRTDILPTADHAFVKALQALLQLPQTPKRKTIKELTASWSPWRSLAVWYLWQYYGELRAG